MPKITTRPKSTPPGSSAYQTLLLSVSATIESARHAAARAVNLVITATNWDVGRQIVEFEQGGKARAEYGAALLARLSGDLMARHGRGYGVDNLELFRRLYLAYPVEWLRSNAAQNQAGLPGEISEFSIRKSSPSIKSGPISESTIRKLSLETIATAFPLSWTHYVQLVRRTKTSDVRRFYEQEALRGGWTIKQLDRQISSKFYERTLLSRNKAAMLSKGGKAHPGDAITADEEIRDPLVLEFLNLRDEYSESDLEEALIRHLETFLMELGNDFAFIGRQRRLRIGSEWYRVDLLFFHRRLRCLVVIDLKLGKFTHADAGQMHLYLNYARAHWTHDGENPPVGLILCAEKDESVAKYALENLGSKVLAREYQMMLPNEKLLAAELEKTRHQLEARR